MNHCAGALVALALVASSARVAPAQDTVARPRHLLALDVTRVRPFARSYDMMVHAGDSTSVIGQRDVLFLPSTYAGQPAWLLTETRTGLVPSTDSLFLALDMRPIHWSSELGKSRLGVEFSGDSIFGAVVTPSAKRSMILSNPPDLLVSAAMIEALVGLLPLTADWSDSAYVLAVDAGNAIVVPAELAIVGVEASPNDTTGDSTWVMAVRADRAQLQFWIAKNAGEVKRVEQTLPAHVGSRLELRLRPTPAPGVTLPP